MFKMSNLWSACCFVGILTASAVVALGQGVPAGLRFTSEKFGFSMAVPDGWSAVAIGAAPMFFNFDPGKSLPTVSLPEGGASIGMEVEYKAPRAEPSAQWHKTLLENAIAIARGGGDPDPVLTPVPFPPAAEVPSAYVTAYDLPSQSPMAQVQHCVMLFWEFKNMFIEAHLHYIKGDPKGTLHEKVFLDTIRSTRPLSK